MKVVELRAELKKRGLDTKGAKVALEARLCGAIEGGAALADEKGSGEEAVAVEPANDKSKRGGKGRAKRAAAGRQSRVRRLRRARPPPPRSKRLPWRRGGAKAAR